MPTGVNEFLPFGTGASPNIEPQADYLADPDRSSGFQTGTAFSAKMNKVWRQSSMMAHAVAQMLANRGDNVMDASDPAALIDLLTKHTTFPAGTRMLFQQELAPLGWTKDLTHNNKALRIVNGPVGAGGTLDFTAAFTNRPLTGATIASGGVAGSTGGHSLTVAEMPTHAHAVNITDPGHQHVVNIIDPGHTHPSPTYGALQLAGGSQGNQPHPGNTGSSPTGITASSNPVVTGITAASVSMGGGVAHTHPFDAGNHTHALTPGGIDMSVKYVDFIIAVKD